MASAYTIEGPSDRCKRVKSGGKRKGCTIEVCKKGKRWKFQKGTYRCR